MRGGVGGQGACPSHPVLPSFRRPSCPPPSLPDACAAGLPKHHIYNANLMKNGADFAVNINTAQEFDGCDSGAPTLAAAAVAHQLLHARVCGSNACENP